MLRYTRITVALTLGSIIILGAFYLQTQTATYADGPFAVVTDGELRGYAPPTDENNNGVPDWEEALTAKTMRLAKGLPKAPTTTNTTYTKPDTLTGQFAEKFFEQYVRTSAAGTEPSETQTQQFLATSISSLTREVRDDLYTRADIRTTDTSLATLRDYGNRVMTIIAAQPPAAENEAVVFQRALTEDNEAVLRDLDPIIDGYATMIRDTKALAVPEELADEHLYLLNAYQAVHNDIIGMRNGFSDPLYAMIRTKRYQEDARAILFALSDIFSLLETAGVHYSSDEPGRDGSAFIQ